MSKVNLKKSKMLKLFEKKKCLTLTDLSIYLKYSDRSAQRQLKNVGYYSSFTHNGKWYTLQSIPRFDVNGLWFYQNVGFSKHRNLTATILYLIENSTSGLMASDLSGMLLTSCPPVLNRIHKDKKICRVKTPRGFVYISIDPRIKKSQLNSLDKAKALPRLSDANTIVILVEFIQNPYRTSEELALQLKKKEGVYCSADTVNNLFVFLGLEKKTPKRPKKLS